MYTIDILLRGTPMSLSVQKKEEEAAQAAHKQITDALQLGTPKILELTCDRDEGKKITVIISEVIAVQISNKAGATGTGRGPGFFGQLTAQADNG
ncbi:hypothetical protein [Lyngbya confervoides]|uniref:UPF0367 protein QQ91_0017930 n=1 Tax=Lyngbya confervoides BDU141951 TaxID=1574623 RepID=A0ABD4T7V2_9CYAN|nr:hypothetical protein [Lyngbya confervoides]MCM1984706.1 hypothetical protein [Lyngbya confervoides BDU141951]